MFSMRNKRIIFRIKISKNRSLSRFSKVNRIRLRSVRSLSRFRNVDMNKIKSL